MPILRLDRRPERLHEWLGAMWRHRAVLVALSRKEFRVRYKRASLGVLWAFGVPLLQTVVLVFIFSRVGRFGTGESYSYAGFVLAGMTPWLYVSASVTAATTSIVDGASLTDKVWFPRAVLALVPSAANLVTLGVSLLLLLIALPILGVDVSVRLLLLVPAAALALSFSAAMGLVLSAAQVYFRDVKFMVQAVVMVWLYVTPIVYPPSALGRAGRWLDFNPLTGIVGLFQHAAVGAPVPSGRALLVSLITTAIFMLMGIEVQRRRDRLFVDLL